MKPTNSLVVFTAASIIASLTIVAGCSKPSNTDTKGAAQPAGTPQAGGPQAGSPAEARAPSKLGDLSSFRAIAADVAALVDKSDLAGAKARIKDLEVAWDSAEAGLKPRAADDWHVVDKAIDKSLGALRAATPNTSDCKQAMAELLKTFDSISAKG